MADTKLDIEFQTGRREYWAVRFAPGETVAGTVHVLTDQSVKCRHLHVRLGWHTEGRGGRDAKTVAEVDLYQGQIEPNMPLSRPFQLELPESPWSYAGHYVSILWDVTAQIDVPWARDVTASVPIVLAPAPR